MLPVRRQTHPIPRVDCRAPGQELFGPRRQAASHVSRPRQPSTRPTQHDPGRRLHTPPLQIPHVGRQARERYTALPTRTADTSCPKERRHPEPRPDPTDAGLRLTVPAHGQLPSGEPTVPRETAGTSSQPRSRPLAHGQSPPHRANRWPRLDPGSRRPAPPHAALACLTARAPGPTRAIGP